MTSQKITQLVLNNKEQLTNEYKVQHIYLVGSCMDDECVVKNDINLIIELSNHIDDHLSAHAELMIYLEDLLEYPLQITLLRSKVTRLTEDALENKHEIF